MRGSIYQLGLVVILLTCSTQTSAQSDRQAQDSLKAKLQTGQSITQDTLVQVRVYPDWINQPKEYKLVSVPLCQLSITHGDIADKFGREPERAALVITTEDQEDSIVKSLFDGYILLNFYLNRSHKFSIWPQKQWGWRNTNEQNRYKTWTFEDVDGNLLVNVPVDICITSDNFYDSIPYIWIKTVKTNENAELELPILLSPAQVLYAFVHHPDCGVAIAKEHRNKKYKTIRRMVAPARSKDQWCVFADALGNPIPNATVEVRLGPEWHTKSHDPSITVTLDEKGRLRPPVWDPNIVVSHFIFQHPDYGRVLVEPLRNKITSSLIPYRGLSICTVPLVKIGSEADRRSIWGAIVDHNQKPLPNVIIKSYAATKAGDGMIRTITDSNGRFCWYIPQKVEYDCIPTLNPLGHKHYVTIISPENFGLEEMKTYIESGRESTITLHPIEEKPIHTPLDINKTDTHKFAFEDHNGLITDTKILSNITISFIESNPSDNPQGTKYLKYDQWKQGGQLPIGTYQAHIQNSTRIFFDTLCVEPNSPELLVFKPTPAITYEGLIFDGISDKPLENAVVVAGGFTKRNDFHLTQQDWDELYARIKNPSATIQYDPKTNLPAIWGPVAITDESGHYRLNLKPGQIRRNALLLFIAKDYMPLERWKFPVASNYITRSKNDTNQPIAIDSNKSDLNVTRLFPGAFVTFEPNLPPTKGHQYPLNFKWELERDNNPNLTYDLEKTQDGGHLVSPPPNIITGRNYTIPIPAEKHVRIQLYEPRQNQYLPFVKTGVNLQRGEVLNLGVINLELAVPITLQAIKGLTVTVTGERTPKIKAAADWYGKVTFAVAPDDNVRFTTHLAPYAGKPEMTESMDCQIDKDMQRGMEVKMILPDEFINRTIYRN